MIKLDMAETFLVSVGEQGKEFTMHKHIAIRHSPFFKAALSHDWREAHDKRISLPDCEPEIFEGYSQWVYTSEISFSTEPHLQTLELVRLWILGDFLRDQRFCETVVNGLFSHELVTGPTAVRHLYDHTSHDSPLRWHILNIWGMRCDVVFISELLTSNPEYPKASSSISSDS